MTALHRLMRGETEIGFVRHANRWFLGSGAAILISILAVVFLHLNFGIDFRGGEALSASNPAGASVPDIRSAVTNAGGGDATVQLLNNGEAVRIQTEVLQPDQETALIAAVADVTGTEPAQVSADSVGPTFGSLVARQALIALVVFLAVVALYMTIRLELKMALVGLVALGHDLIITVGIYALTGFEVTPATVVAILTILGYSLYDTVVVFDKVDEFVGSMDKSTYGDIVERAMNAVLARSLATSLTSLLPVGSILLVGSFILGAPSLREFALALFVGMAAGTYSSVFLAGPMLARWKEGEEEWQEKRRRIEARQTRRG